VSGSPAARLIAAAQEAPAATDSRGRTLTLRHLSALDKLRLFKAAGPTLAQNGPWMGVALLAASVAAIDDVPVPAPVTEAQIEALVGRLGEEGLAAVADALAVPVSADEVAATAGNSHGTPT
jgi:hypothetical protein